MSAIDPLATVTAPEEARFVLQISFQMLTFRGIRQNCSLAFWGKLGVTGPDRGDCLEKQEPSVPLASLGFFAPGILAVFLPRHQLHFADWIL